MKILLTVAAVTDEDLEDTAVYVSALQKAVSYSITQGFPGAFLVAGDGAVWVSDVEVVLDTEPNKV